ncbi:M56 family metallopeptidase [Saccharopolyspora sp. HNM0986]|uniref:M56 family metallopeptidase n=1 Tax=Saccharopolyspora galaxeae TaxID=2781241 RepID=UPI00190BFC2A|nr:M56 family metallopeptidase [Saccharopolyspora sp. HNM0986]MBK0868760.1 M56 family metallopeptidase [Saccharopolyspora sp. HNM0986]
MTPLLLGLSAYTVAFAVFGPRLMHACELRQRAAPRFGLVLWTALPTSWIIAVLAVGLAATAQLSGGLGLAGLLHACLRAVQVILGVHHPADVPAAVALLGSLTILLRLGGVATRQAHHDRKQRRTHQRGVCGPMRTAHRAGQRVSIVDSPTPAAYCVPGRRSAIVLTTGALWGLPPRQLDAVIAHEQAHLRGRHHLYVAWGSILAKAFPFIPLLRSAPHELARLVEWLADDYAGRRHGRHSVARAVATMATGVPSPTSPRPDAALTATGSDVLDRVRRLIEPHTTARGARWPVSTAITAPVLVLAAATAVLIPAATADPTPLCQDQQPPTHAQHTRT